MKTLKETQRQKVLSSVCQSCYKKLSKKTKTGYCLQCYKISPEWKEKYKKISITHKLNGVGKWMKGRKIPQDVIEKRASKLRGKKRPPFSKEWKLKIGMAGKGRKWTPEALKNLKKSKEKYIYSIEYREKMRKSILKRAYKHTEEDKIKFSIQKKGPLNPNWNNNASVKNWGARQTQEYRNWSKAVLKRDKYTCLFCGFKGRNKLGSIVLHADHIQPFSKYPELRFELSNGRTLCVPCHKKTPTYGFRRYI